VSAENVKTVESMYAAFAKGDIPTVLAALDPQVEWWEAENFIYAEGNPYVGPEAVLQGVFMRIGSEWDGFAVSPTGVLDAGDTAVGHGTTAERTNKRASRRARNSHTSSRFATARSSSFSSTPTRHSSNK
jgi:ketosteroid isomerase-like protein